MGNFAKIGIILANLIAAAGALGYGAAVESELSEEMVLILENDHHWLGVCVALFAVNGVVAWQFRNRWSISSVRMLMWAVIAYLGISQLVDLIGLSGGAVSQILSGSSEADTPADILGIRARLFSIGALVAMSISGVAIGFESKKDNPQDQPG